MARHEVVIRENTGALRETAPYVGNYISKEQIAMQAFASAVGAKCGLPPIQVIAIIGGAFEAIADLELEALVRVRTDLGVVCGVITGSFPTADAVFDTSRNKLELVLRLDDTIRLDLADTVPTIVTDEDVTKLRVHNVMDLVEERPMNLIHGQRVFRVAGFNMVLSDEGAEVYLQNALGTTFQLVIDEVVSKQLFTAHTAELLPAGDYKLVVKSRAGDAGGPLQTSFRRVKYLHTTDPGPVPIAQTSDGKCKIMSMDDEGSTTDFLYGSAWNVNGTGIYGDRAAPGGEWEIARCSVSVDGSDYTLAGNFDEDGTHGEISPLGGDTPARGTYHDIELSLVASRGTESETLTITLPTFVVE